MAPNIVLIVIDDLGWRDLTCYGSGFYETPNIDGLAAEGMSFSDAYASAPVCSPTRASLMTGKYPATVGITEWIGGHSVGKLCDVPYFSHLPLSEYSLARALRDGGYRTWHVGKWHLGFMPFSWPTQHGFDVNVAGGGWGSPRSYFSPYSMATLPDGPSGEYLTDRITDEAIALLESHADEGDERPFFLNLWHYAVHTPIEAPPDLVLKYEAKAAALGLGAVDPFEDGGPIPAWVPQPARIRRRTVQSDPAYAAMVENLDTNIGRLLDALGATGHGDDTIVVFTSDNGGLATAGGSPTCNAPLSEGKGWMYDGGIRVPLVVRWPGVVSAGSRCTTPVTSPDLYPTFLGSAGLPSRPDQHVDGVDVRPLLRGETFDRGPLFWHYPHYGLLGGTPAASVRDGDWKLVRFFEDDHVELYDLRDDMSEAFDRAPEEAAVAARLSSALDEWIGRVGAIVPRPNPTGPYPEFTH